MQTSGVLSVQQKHDYIVYYAI